MQKQLTFHGEAREAILNGVEKLAKAVVSTLGPKGRCAVLDKSWGGPTITKDGVTVARDIDLIDRSETSARSWSNKQPPKPTIVLATAPPPPPCWPGASTKRPCAIFLWVRIPVP